MVLHISFFYTSMEVGHSVLTLYTQKQAVSNQEPAYTWDTVWIGLLHKKHFDIGR